MAKGAYFVLLDGTPRQIALASALRGQARHFRVGPADKAYDHAAYQHSVQAFAGNGLRPYSPVHLSAEAVAGGLSVTWIRRARLDADGWDLPEIPLGEDREAYALKVLSGGAVVRSVELTASEWVYTTAMQSEDGATGAVGIEVAQVSDRFGAGPAARVTVAL